MAISEDKKRRVHKAVHDLATISDQLGVNTLSFQPDERWAEIPDLITQAQELLKEIQVLTCPHRAFAAGRCFRCNATHEEAK